MGMGGGAPGGRPRPARFNPLLAQNVDFLGGEGSRRVSSPRATEIRALAEMEVSLACLCFQRTF